MELEFDKEIDALLRKAKRALPAREAVPGAGHLDADELAAFAENALPDRTRHLYTAHLTDCDMCRKTLSGFIATQPEAVVVAASPSAASTAIASEIPWFKRLFAMPNLAYTMGGLVVLFSGIIGLLVWQSGLSGGQTELSRTTDSQPAAAPPEREAPAFSTNTTTVNTNANANMGSAVEDVTRSGVAVGTSNVTVPTDQESKTPSVEETRPTVSDVAKNEPSASTAGAPIPPKSAPAAKDDTTLQAERDRPAAKAKEENAVTVDGVNADELKKRADKQSNSLEISPGTRSARNLRLEGPRQTQTQTQTQAGNTQGQSTMLSNLRTAGGKKFELRDRVWYDTAYTGQDKKDIKRGSDKYRKLDAGLRSIAEQIGGTVVVVWNGQAYKIK